MPHVKELDGQVIAPVVDHLLVGVLLEVVLRQGVNVLRVDVVAHGVAQFDLPALVRGDFQIFGTDAAVVAVEHQPGPFYLLVIVALPLRVGEGQGGLGFPLEILQFPDFRQQVRLSLEIDGVVDVEERIGILSCHQFPRMLLIVSLRQH